MMTIALKYYKLGWCVIPVLYGKKEASIKWGKYQKKRPDESMISQWFKNGKANIAVLLGEISGGLTCLDFDEMQGYELWKQENPILAVNLPTVMTSRGMHVYFRSKLTKTSRKEKLDIKASGYCILPPSLHPDGETFYNWLIEPNGDIPKLTLQDLGIDNLTEETEDKEAITSISSVSSLSSLSSIPSLSSPSSLSSIKLDVVIWEKLNDDARHYINMAIKHTLPNKTGYRNFLIFQFCRWLKGYAEFEKLEAAQLKPLVKMWHEQALPFIDTKLFDETWADFAFGWRKVKYPKGNGALKIATQKAMNVENKLNAEKLYEKPEMKLMVRLCFELQVLQQKEPFWLSVNDAALILGITPPTAAKWLCMLEEDKVIQKIEEYTSMKARRYIFLN